NILSNGIIVYIGGFEYLAGTTTNTAININHIRLFDTKKYEWSQMNAIGETVDPRWFFTSVLTPDGYIIILGGCTFEEEFSNVYSVSPTLAMLDTNKSPFEWSIPE
ncbi:21810_t:CDS:2, partial [Dentiscutata erythropus]